MCIFEQDTQLPTICNPLRSLNDIAVVFLSLKKHALDISAMWWSIRAPPSQNIVEAWQEDAMLYPE